MPEPTLTEPKPSLTDYLVEHFGGEDNTPQRWNASVPESNAKLLEIVTVHDVDERQRSKLWFSPLVEVNKANGTVVTVFGKAVYVTGDPQKYKPDRPEGHFSADNLNPTARWEDEALKNELQAVNNALLIPWEEVRDDGGSNYYEYRSESGRTYVKQVVKSSGRVLIGVKETQTLSLQNQSTGQEDRLSYILVKRLVTVEGSNGGRSPVGSTNYDFGGFVIEE